MKGLVSCLLLGLIFLSAGTARAEGGAADKRTASLLESMKDPDPMVRQGAARDLGESKDAAAAVQALSEALVSDPDETVRLVALGALEIISDRRAVPYYARALKDESEKVRRSAAEALSGMWDEAAHGALIDALKTDISPKVRRCAAEALGNPGVMGKYSAHGWDRSADTAAALMSALKDDDSYEVRSAAAAQLGKFKVERVVESLIAALDDKSAPVRAAAAESLGMLEDPEGMGKLLDVLYFEKDEMVLVSALKALKFSDDPRLAEPAVAALDSGSSRVRWQAVDLIEVLRPQSAIEPLRKMVEDKYESEGIRVKAREALQLMGAE